MELDLRVEIATIELLNSELLKENFNEYQKSVDILVLLNGNIYIEIEINLSNFAKVKLRNFLYSDKIFSSLLERGNSVEKLKDIYFYQLNLNTEDKTISYGEEVVVAYGIKTKSIFMDYKYIVLKQQKSHSREFIHELDFSLFSFPDLFRKIYLLLYVHMIPLLW